MKTTFKTFLVLAIGLLFTSCFIDTKGVQGSGNVTKENRSLSGFTNINVDSGMEVTVTHGETFEVIVEADDNVQSHIMTTVENGTLYISSDANTFTDVTKHISVKMPRVEGIEVGSGATLESGNTLRGTNIKITANGGSSITLDLEADNISTEANSGSSVTLKGIALVFTPTAGEGSSITAKSLTANDVTAAASSGSSVEVQAAVSLNADASGGSSIEYHGEPTKVVVNKDSGGDVSKI
jgi:hypothetical protein